MSAVTYVNKLGGTVSQNLTVKTKDLWLWCLQRDKALIAEHLPGMQNTIVDKESHVIKDRTDLKLNLEVFSQIDRQLGPLAVDLFASRLTNQLPQYFSWRPDPVEEAMNAFSQQWDKWGVGGGGGGKGYANPPWNLVGRILSQVQAQQVCSTSEEDTGMVPHSPGNTDRIRHQALIIKLG